MFHRRKVFLGILIISLIAIFSCILFFISDRNKKPDSVSQTSDNTSVTDFTELDSALDAVPISYTVLFDEANSSYLSELLDYVDANKSTMNQITADDYAMLIRKVVNTYCPYTDVPQIYIKVDNMGTINSEYSAASIIVIDSKDGKGKDIVDESANIKLHGNSTKEVDKKAYTIKFSQKEDLLGMGKGKKWILLANAFDKTLMRNKLVFDFASNIGMQNVPDSIYVDVWLNDKFAGNYLLTEVIEASPTRVDINTDQGDVLIEREQEQDTAGVTYFTTSLFEVRFGINDPQDITDKQVAELTNFLGKVEKALQDKDWKQLTNYVDEKSYIDFYILSELFKTVDFNGSSTRYYIKNGKLYAGPPWDYDLSTGNADKDFYYYYNYHEGYGPESSYLGLSCENNLYSNCLEIPEFRDALSKRYNELQDVITNLYEDNSLGTNQIDLLTDKYGQSFQRNYSTAGWKIRKEFILERDPDSTYEQNVEYLKGWLEKRNTFLLSSFN